jgi:hypothetical protein
MIGTSEGRLDDAMPKTVIQPLTSKTTLGPRTTPPIEVLVPEPEGLLKLNDPSKYSVPLLDIG